MQDDERSAAVTRFGAPGVLAPPGIAVLLLLAGGFVWPSALAFLALVVAFVVALVGVGLAVGALNAGRNRVAALTGLAASALVFVLALSIMAGLQ